ncbi:MAG: hypothetical protein ACK5MT_16620 [Actinomycetales bacterium]
MSGTTKTQGTGSKVAIAVGLVLVATGIVKLSILGYYEGEQWIFLVLMAVGAVMVWAGNKFG